VAQTYSSDTLTKKPALAVQAGCSSSLAPMKTKLPRLQSSSGFFVFLVVRLVIIDAMNHTNSVNDIRLAVGGQYIHRQKIQKDLCTLQYAVLLNCVLPKELEFAQFSYGSLSI
jgi:hypothetical protein